LKCKSASACCAGTSGLKALFLFCEGGSVGHPAGPPFFLLPFSQRGKESLNRSPLSPRTTVPTWRHSLKGRDFCGRKGAVQLSGRTRISKTLRASPPARPWVGSITRSGGVLSLARDDCPVRRRGARLASGNRRKAGRSARAGARTDGRPAGGASPSSETKGPGRVGRAWQRFSRFIGA
jgi:hypothetical protein